MTFENPTEGFTGNTFPSLSSRTEEWDNSWKDWYTFSQLQGLHILIPIIKTFLKGVGRAFTQGSEDHYEPHPWVEDSPTSVVTAEITWGEVEGEGEVLRAEGVAVAYPHWQ